MRKFILFTLIFMSCFMAFASGAEVVGEPGISTDYGAMITSFAGFVSGVMFLIEGIKKLFPKMKGLGVQIVSWGLGVLAAMLLWFLNAGFLSGLEWYIALLYGFGASLVSNGIADTGLVEWIIGLFAQKKIK